jgi:uncharacterized coiled-coil DUF342 family protein
LFESRKRENLIKKMSAAGNSRKNCQYSAETLHHAIEEVRNGLKSVWEASQHFKIPYQTLKNKIDGLHNGNYGTSTVLTAEEEAELASWIKERARRGYPIERKEFLDVAVKIAQSRDGKQFGMKGLAL